MSPEAVLLTALVLGIGSAGLTEYLSARERRAFELPALNQRTRWFRVICIVVLTFVLVRAYHWASIDVRCLDTDEVQPSWLGRNWRFAYHAVLLSLLVAATFVDFDCYMIPDLITVPGALFGLFGACVIQEMQICHLWVDWSVARRAMQGPLIPSWYDAHRFWHAFAWSLTGLIAGASLTWVARLVSSRVLGKEAMGFGDVTLMGMIGSYIGWQAVTLVFLIAPLTGLTFGILIRTLTGKSYLPYGPWLGMATVIVLFNWARLWQLTRLTFSDWFSVVVLTLIGTIGFVVLLWLLQLYKRIPTRKDAVSS